MSRAAALLTVPFLFALSACSSATDDSGPVVASGGSVAGLGGSGSGGDVAASGGSSNVGKEGKYVVGYLPTYRSWEPSSYDLDALTHLCLAFANPSGSSNVAFGNKTQAQVQGIVDAAHAKNVLVLASIAGASGGAAVSGQITAGNVDAYVSELVAFMTAHNLDGIDVDIEGEYVNADYEPFVKKLSAALPEGKLLTAAVANWNGYDFSDGALAEYDFINVMSYDACGSWSSQCEHSTYAKAQTDMEYWTVNRGLAADKVVLGVPFYGYCWGDACQGDAMVWSEIIAKYPEAKDQDLITKPDFYLSFNSPLTIASKKTLADTYAGIMIWELGQDASGADSLLSVIKSN